VKILTKEKRKLEKPKMRHEQKYFINEADAWLLGRRLPLVMKRDENSDENGEYFIRSLYFDDNEDSAFFDKLAGVQNRDKYRIRIYNLSDKVIKLERKSKRGDYITKSSLTISRSLCDQLIAGDTNHLQHAADPLLQDFYVQMVTKGLHPAVIVDYVREAFVYPVEDVRVTLDKHLRSGLYSHDLFSPNVVTVPPVTDPTVILEIKYNRKMPDMIPGLVDVVESQRCAISKYTLCRGYE